MVGLLLLVISNLRLGWDLLLDFACGDTLLRPCYPELCARSHNKEAYVVDLMKFPNGVLYWNLNFVRAFSLGVLNAKFLAFSTPNTKKLPSSDVLYVKKI